MNAIAVSLFVLQHSFAYSAAFYFNMENNSRTLENTTIN